MTILCLDCPRPNCPHVLQARLADEQTSQRCRREALLRSSSPLPPLGEVQQLMLDAIEAWPGISRAELSAIVWPKLNPYYSVPRSVLTAKSLERRGLIEFGVIHEGGRQGVQGLYLVGKSRPVKPGYFGINGWVSPKEKRRA